MRPVALYRALRDAATRELDGAMVSRKRSACAGKALHSLVRAAVEQSAHAHGHVQVLPSESGVKFLHDRNGLVVQVFQMRCEHRISKRRDERNKLLLLML